MARLAIRFGRDHRRARRRLATVSGLVAVLMLVLAPLVAGRAHAAMAGCDAAMAAAPAPAHAARHDPLRAAACEAACALGGQLLPVRPTPLAPSRAEAAASFTESPQALRPASPPEVSPPPPR